jgi:hypothetical protein
MKNANALEIGGCVLAILCGSETWSRAPEDVAAAAPAHKANTASAKPSSAKAGSSTAATAGVVAPQQ